MRTEQAHNNMNDELDTLHPTDTVPATSLRGISKCHRLLGDYNAWSVWRRNGFEDYGNSNYASWSEMRFQVEDAIQELKTYYWAGRSRFMIALDFKEKLESLRVFDFTQSIDHVTCLLPDSDIGDIELRLIERSGGALQDIVALIACSLCKNIRQSLPITEGIHLVAFALGLDSPCLCQTMNSEDVKD